MSRSVLWIALMAVVLAGCGRVIIYGVDYDSYMAGDADFAGGGRDFLTVIRGNPFTQVSKQKFDQAVTDPMQTAPEGFRTHFTTRPSANARIAYRIVLLFDGPKTAIGSDLCQSLETLGSRPQSRTIRIQGAFCVDDHALSEAIGEMRRVSGPRHRDFAFLIDQITKFLLPVYDPQVFNEDDESPGVNAP